MSATPEVIFEDNHLLVVNKPAGMLTQGDRTGDRCITDWAKDYLKKKYNKPGNVFVGLPHRIDRPVSGVMVLCRTSKATTRMNAQFKDRQVKKTYWATVKDAPDPPQGKRIQFLKKNQKNNKSYVVKEGTQGALKAELTYFMIQSIDRYHLIEVHPHTGRHHQIRVQLADIGCPIKGDLKYGYPRSNKDASIHLHARTIEFTHPVTKEPLVLRADPPDDPVWNAFKEGS